MTMLMRCVSQSDATLGKPLGRITLIRAGFYRYERFSSLTAGKVYYDSESALLSFGKHMLLVLNPASSGAIADSPKPNSSHFRISLSFPVRSRAAFKAHPVKHQYFG